MFAAHPLTWKPFQSSASRRVVLQSLAGSTGTALALIALGENVAARKKRKRKGRKKKRKNPDQPPTPQPPAPETRAAATCPGPGENPFFLDPQSRIGQSFTSSVSGPLVRAELAIRHRAESAGDYFLRLAPLGDGGLPTEASLASVQVPGESVPDGESQVAFTFRQPAQVQAGESYALVLTRGGPDTYTWLARVGSPCAGRGFFSESLTGPFEPHDEFDLVFTVFVTG